MSDSTVEDRKVFVGGLGPWVTEKMITTELFRDFDVETTSALTHLQVSMPYHFIFVNFASQEQASRAIRELHKTSFHGNLVSVKKPISRPHSGRAYKHYTPSGPQSMEQAPLATSRSSVSAQPGYHGYQNMPRQSLPSNPPAASSASAPTQIRFRGRQNAPHLYASPPDFRGGQISRSNQSSDWRRSANQTFNDGDAGLSVQKDAPFDKGKQTEEGHHGQSDLSPPASRGGQINRNAQSNNWRQPANQAIRNGDAEGSSQKDTQIDKGKQIEGEQGQNILSGNGDDEYKGRLTHRGTRSEAKASARKPRTYVPAGSKGEGSARTKDKGSP